MQSTKKPKESKSSLVDITLLNDLQLENDITIKTPKQLKQQQQKQLQQILNETFANTVYCDQDIGQYLNDGAGDYRELFGRKDSGGEGKGHGEGWGHGSRARSESGSEGGAYREEFGHLDYSSKKVSKNSRLSNQDQHQDNLKQQQYDIKSSQQEQAQLPTLPQQIQSLQTYYQTYKRPHTLSQIKQKYPNFIVSNPTYNLGKTYEQNVFQFNTLRDVDIQVVDIGFCQIADNFRIAIGVLGGKVAVFDRTYTKPVNKFDAFIHNPKKQKHPSTPPPISIPAIKWSPNLQYLAVSSSTKQLKVYQYKQSITIEQNTILRMEKQPQEIIVLGPKELRYAVTAIRFVSESPLVMLLGDENDEMLVLEYRMNYINFRAFLGLLPIRFNDVFQVQLADFVIDPKPTKPTTHTDYNSLLNTQTKPIQPHPHPQIHGTLMAVSSSEYVTIALLRPHFEVIMVYDKEKHGKNIRKEGYAHVSFRKEPLGILIVWDKFVHFLEIQVLGLGPLVTRVGSGGSQVLAETTLAAGLVTDTLLYQISQSGLKIYTATNPHTHTQPQTPQFHNPIYSHPINFFELPSGLTIQQQLVNSTPTLPLLKMLNSIIKVCHGYIFITSNTSLFSVRIERFEEFVWNVIENVNNWKVGLQVMNDAYLGKFDGYDNMTRGVIVKNIQEYTLKYINFLQMVIGNTNHNQDAKNEQIMDQSQHLLWCQQTTFLFNILIQTQQYKHLYTKILPKLQSYNLGYYMTTLQPFILLHKLPQLTSQGLQLLYRHIDPQTVKVLLIANITPQCNEPQLPHMLNKVMLEHRMYEEMAAVNVVFRDYFNVFAVLVAQYRGIDVAEQLNSLGRSEKSYVDILMQQRDNREYNQLDQNQDHLIRQKEQSDDQHDNRCQTKQNIQKQALKKRLRQLLIYFSYKIIQKINTNQDLPPSFSQTNQKKHLQTQKHFLQSYLPLLQSSIIPILLDDPQTESTLFQLTLPQLFSGQCLQLINSISNKHLNGDLMTEIVMGVPVERVRDLRLYWLCVVGLFNRGVVRVGVFVGVRFLVRWEIGAVGELEREGEGEGEASGQKEMGEENYMDMQQSNHKPTNRKPKKPKNKTTLKKIAQITQVRTLLTQTTNTSTHKLFEQFRRLSNQLLQQLYNELLCSSVSLSFSSKHIGLLRILALILGSGYYMKVIQAMLVQTEPSIIITQQHPDHDHPPPPYTVFEFIQQSIPNYSKSQKQQLKVILQENIQYFIKLNCPKLCDLIVEEFLDSIDGFVGYSGMTGDISGRVAVGGRVGKSKSLGEGMVGQYGGIDANTKLTHSRKNITNPIHQHHLLTLIEHLLHRLQHPQIQSLKLSKLEPHSEWMLALRLKFLQLLALTGRQHQILSEVKKQTYPLDSSLDICRRYGVIDAEAYLLVKSGGEGEFGVAIELYFQVCVFGYLQLIGDRIRVLTPDNLASFRDYFLNIMKQCIKVCQSLHADEEIFNQQWFMISQQLYELKTAIYKILPAYTCDLFCDIIQKQVYKLVGEKMVRKQNINGIIEYLRLNIQYIDITFTRLLLNQILKNYAFQKVMYLLTQQTFITSQLKQRLLIHKGSIRGFPTRGTCMICYQQNGIIIHYSNCGHEIHPSCGQDVKLCIICSCRDEKVVERQVDLLRKVKVEMFGYEVGEELVGGLQERERVRKESRMDRLRKFDLVAVGIVYD